MKIKGLQIKVITIKNAQYAEGMKYMREQGYTVLGHETHGDLVTIAGQKGEEILRYNLERKTLETLRSWAEIDGLSVTRAKVVNADLSKRDVKALFESEKESASNSIQKSFFWEKWGQIGSIEALFTRPAAARREALKSAGVNPFKKVTRTVALTKQEMIEKLVMSGIKTYEAYSDILTTSKYY